MNNTIVPCKYPLIVNQKKQTITIGEFVISGFDKSTHPDLLEIIRHAVISFFVPKHSDFLYDLAKINHVTSPFPRTSLYFKNEADRIKYIIEFNRYYLSLFGPGIIRRLKKVFWLLYIKPNREFIYGLCHCGKPLHIPDIVNLLKSKRHLAMLKQAMVDNQKNLLPWINFARMPPEKLKALLGKGLWKNLCRNSFTRNLNIVFLLNHSGVGIHDGCFYSIILKLVTMKCVYLRSGFVKDWTGKAGDDLPSIDRFSMITWVYFNIIGDQACTPLLNAGRTDWYANTLVRAIVGLRDTKSMAATTNSPFSYEWSRKRMELEHNRLMAIISEALYPSEVFGITQYFPAHYRLNDVEAVLLDSPCAVNNEGLQLHHCVANRINSIKQAKQLIYSVRSSEPDLATSRSTLAFTIDHKKKSISILEHVIVCNDPPTVVHKVFATQLLEYLVKEFSKPFFASNKMPKQTGQSCAA